MSVHRFKVLLDAMDGDGLSSSEQREYDELIDLLAPEIASEDGLTSADVRDSIRITRIDTRSERLRAPETSSDFHAGNLLELEEAIYLTKGNNPTMPEVRSAYSQIVLLIIRKIVVGRGVSERQIFREDVVGCCSANHAISTPDLAQLPGDTPLEKKAILGGFDATETETFRRQRMLAEADVREADVLGESVEVERLIVQLLDLQHQLRDEAARVERKVPVGPEILRRLRVELPGVKSGFAGSISRLDDSFCLGLLWRETDQCAAWWHGFGDRRDVH